MCCFSESKDALLTCSNPQYRRREQRARSSYIIWAPSPPPSDESDSEDGQRRRKKSKRSGSKRDKKDRKKSSSSSKKRRHRHDDDSDYDSEYERERRHRRKHHRGSSRRSRSRSQSRDRPSRRHSDSTEEDGWVEKGSTSHHPQELISTAASRAAAAAGNADEGSSDDDQVGPMPAGAEMDIHADPRAYGGALRPGEGSAIAAYVQSGQRIPRRGEIGLESHEIEKYEQAGFVMSGSRHRRMNAIRMRKENQVISAEEKRGLLKMQMDEKAKREQDVITSFKERQFLRLLCACAERDKANQFATVVQEKLDDKGSKSGASSSRK